MPRNGIFISYSSHDGAVLADELRDTFEQHDLSVWQNIVKMEGGRDWWQQITDALDQVEYMVLVATPASMDSRVVRKEWHYGRQQGVCVYPVYSPDNTPDFDSMPNWMRNTHFYNYGEPAQRKKLLVDLNTRCVTPRVPFMVDDLPEDYVNRLAEFEALVSKLLDANRDNPVAITAALRGAGGYGKTTLARAICHDEDIQQAFDDGILWVTLGENPGDVTTRLKELITILKPDEQVEATSLETIKTWLREIMEDRDILLVVDDVWKRQDLNPFLNLGERVALLVTTRDDSVLPQDVHRVPVDAMLNTEAVELLAAGLDVNDLRPFAEIATKLGEWALLIKIANGIFRTRIQRGKTVEEALDYLERRITSKGLTGTMQNPNPAARHDAMSLTLDISLEHLKDENPDYLNRYIQLAIFPEDSDIPLAIANRLWSDFDEDDTEDLLVRLHQLSLILNVDLETRTFRFHDVVRTYLQEQNSNHLHAWHTQLLDSYDLKTWADLPEDEPYLWSWLAYHLVESGRTDNLLTTVMDGNYLARKTFFHKDKALAVEQDLVIATQIFHDNHTLDLLKRNYVTMSHILSRIENVSEVAVTLRNRMQHLEELDEFCANVKLTRPYIEPVHSLPDLPHPVLIRTLRGHSNWAMACAISPDSSFIVSASFDNTLKVWDAATGMELRTLSGHMSSVNGCAISPDGAFIVSASSDETLKVWNAATGVEVRTLSGHISSVNGCAISPDGAFIVSASLDNTLKIWDATTGVEVRTLTGHSSAVTDCVVSSDNSFIVSASFDNTLKVWDAATGMELRTLSGHHAGKSYQSVRGCAISLDGSFIVSASDDSTLKVWDVASGAELRTLTGHVARAFSSGVMGCAISPDSSFIVSAASDNTLKVWDVASGAELHTLVGHTDRVNDCAISSDGSFIVSVSEDNTVTMWDVTASIEVHTAHGHTIPVNDCAISPDGAFIVSASDDKTLKMWDTATGTEVHTLTGHTDKVNDCAISPDTTFMVSASDDRTLKMWDTATSTEVHTLIGHTDKVRSCAISSDGSFIVSASRDGTLRIWDAATGGELRTLHAHGMPVSCSVVSPNGSFIVSTSLDRTLKVWNADNGIQIHTLTGHIGGVESCAISPDCAFIVSASEDNTLKVWDVATGTEIRTLTGHTDKVTDCAINADGTLILSASEDNTLRVWDFHTRHCLTTFYSTAPLTNCDWSSDGETIVAGNNLGGVYFLRFVQ